MAQGWLFWKELSGFVGSLMAAAPWVLDFCARVAHEKLRATKAQGKMAKLVEALATQDAEKINEAKRRDLLLTITGLLLLATSFLIGVIDPG